MARILLLTVALCAVSGCTSLGVRFYSDVQGSGFFGSRAAIALSEVTPCEEGEVRRAERVVHTERYGYRGQLSVERRQQHVERSCARH